jgi:hypothetical protein
LGRRVGARTILIAADQRTLTGDGVTPDFVAQNLLEAAELIANKGL